MAAEMPNDLLDYLDPFLPPEPPAAPPNHALSMLKEDASKQNSQDSAAASDQHASAAAAASVEGSIAAQDAQASDSHSGSMLSPAGRRRAQISHPQPVIADVIGDVASVLGDAVSISRDAASTLELAGAALGKPASAGNPVGHHTLAGDALHTPYQAGGAFQTPPQAGDAFHTPSPAGDAFHTPFPAGDVRPKSSASPMASLPSTTSPLPFDDLSLIGRPSSTEPFTDLPLIGKPVPTEDLPLPIKDLVPSQSCLLVEKPSLSASSALQHTAKGSTYSSKSCKQAGRPQPSDSSDRHAASAAACYTTDEDTGGYAGPGRNNSSPTGGSAQHLLTTSNTKAPHTCNEYRLTSDAAANTGYCSSSSSWPIHSFKHAAAANGVTVTSPAAPPASPPAAPPVAARPAPSPATTPAAPQTAPPATPPTVVPAASPAVPPTVPPARPPAAPSAVPPAAAQATDWTSTTATGFQQVSKDSVLSTGTQVGRSQSQSGSSFNFIAATHVYSKISSKREGSASKVDSNPLSTSNATSDTPGNRPAKACPPSPLSRITSKREGKTSKSGGRQQPAVNATKDSPAKADTPSPPGKYHPKTSWDSPSTVNQTQNTSNSTRPNRSNKTNKRPDEVSEVFGITNNRPANSPSRPSASNPNSPTANSPLGNNPTTPHANNPKSNWTSAELSSSSAEASSASAAPSQTFTTLCNRLASAPAARLDATTHHANSNSTYTAFGVPVLQNVTGSAWEEHLNVRLKAKAERMSAAGSPDVSLEQVAHGEEVALQAIRSGKEEDFRSATQHLFSILLQRLHACE